VRACVRACVRALGECGGSSVCARELVYVRADVHLCVLWRGRGITRATHTEWPPRVHRTPRRATQLGQSAARHASLPLLAIAIRTISIRTCDGGWVSCRDRKRRSGKLCGKDEQLGPEYEPRR
jgi:hypothetical protein